MPRLKPKPEGALGVRLQSICVSVWLIDASVWVMVLLRLLVRFCVAAWFAAIPAGMEIIIAMEKPKAMITSKALILRLEIFLKARFMIPKQAPS